MTFFVGFFCCVVDFDLPDPAFATDERLTFFASSWRSKGSLKVAYRRPSLFRYHSRHNSNDDSTLCLLAGAPTPAAQSTPSSTPSPRHQRAHRRTAPLNITPGCHERTAGTPKAARSAHGRTWNYPSKRTKHGREPKCTLNVLAHRRRSWQPSPAQSLERARRLSKGSSSKTSANLAYTTPK